MKNVIIFQDWIREKTYGHEWKQDELFRYFKAQIDNSIRLGWDVKDIVVCTNLNFSYKGVTVIPLYDICQYNKYFNKQYGIAELLRNELITEPFWFHDFDDWQLTPFTFPEFEGSIGVCKYIDDSQWNTGSVFVKPASKYVWELMVEFMKQNENHPQLLQVGDENIFNLIYREYPEIQKEFSKLNNTYNVGVTQFDMRYRTANKPVTIGAFKPGGKGYDNFINNQLIPGELIEIFIKHNLYENN
jgi:hypothetical protein